MGRKKIVIKRLTEDRNRNVTFLKRKHGLLKKAWELSVLCGADVSILIFAHNTKCYEFSSSDLDAAIDRYHAYSGPIERRRAPEFAAMAESGAKDDGSEIDEDELNGTTGPGGAEGGSNAPKGMSLKGKEEWKDVSLPRIGGAVVGVSPASGENGAGMSGQVGAGGVGGIGRNGSMVAGRTRSPPGSGAQKGKTRENVDYLAAGSSTSSNGAVQSMVNNDTTMASRTFTGSWTGPEGGVLGERGAYQDRDENGLMGHQDHRSQANFYQPTKQPSLATLYPRGVRQYDQDRSSMNPTTLYNDTHSFRSEPSRYNSFDTPAFTENTPSSHMNPNHHNNNNGLGSSSSPVAFENAQAYAQYSLPVDHGINSDGSIDWHKASAAAQLQAALHAQQAQLAYLRQQRQQQEHWSELLAASAGGPLTGLSAGMAGAGGGAAVGNAVQRFNELVAAGHDPMALSNGFQWPTGGTGSGGGSGLGLSTVPGNHPSRDHMLDLSVSANSDWYSETSIRSQGGVPFSSHINDGRSHHGPSSRDTSPSSRQPHLINGDLGRGDLSDGGLKREQTGGDEMANNPKRPRMDSMGNS